MTHTNGYSQAWARVYAAGNLTLGVIMLFGTATLVYFFLSQYCSFSPGLFATTCFLLVFVASNAFRQLRRFYEAVSSQSLRGELEFDGLQLVCKAPRKDEIPILREQCRAYYPCREVIALYDGTLVKLRPVHPTARYWGSPYSYFTRTLFEAWWPSVNLDIAEEVALGAFPKQRNAIDAIGCLALVTFLGTGFCVHLSRLKVITLSEKSWVLVPLTMSIGILWLLYLWYQSIREKAVVQLPESNDEESGAA